MDEVVTGFLSDLDRDFYNVFGAPNMTGSPERRLLLAILERAILDYGRFKKQRNGSSIPRSADLRVSSHLSGCVNSWTSTIRGSLKRFARCRAGEIAR
jgi:hypothetical protein